MKITRDGLMVESTLRTVLGNFVRIKSVRATQNKVIRFDPVKALYEQNLVFHLRRFIDLETQLLTYSGNPKQASPNSLDAMVWRNNQFEFITVNLILLFHKINS
jgi:phage terminase large subunit-like protein